MYLFYYFSLIRAETRTGIESLYHDLLHNYDLRVPATVNGSWSKIYRAVDLLWLNKVDAAASLFEASFQFEIFWTDDRLGYSIIKIRRPRSGLSIGLLRGPRTLLVSIGSRDDPRKKTYD